MAADSYNFAIAAESLPEALRELNITLERLVIAFIRAGGTVEGA